MFAHRFDFEYLIQEPSVEQDDEFQLITVAQTVVISVGKSDRREREKKREKERNIERERERERKKENREK